SSLCTFWIVVKLLEVSSSEDPLSRMFDEFCMGTGLNLLVDAVLNYFQILTRSLYLIVVAGIFVVILLAIARWLIPPGKGRIRAGTLLVGCDPMLYQLAQLLGQPIVGMVGTESSCPPEIAFLGHESAIEDILTQRQPRQILAAGDLTSR